MLYTSNFLWVILCSYLMAVNSFDELTVATKNNHYESIAFKNQKYQKSHHNCQEASGGVPPSMIHRHYERKLAKNLTNQRYKSDLFTKKLEEREVHDSAFTPRHFKTMARSLIYPPTAPTRLQFIGGIGIPVEDLHFESVTSGYVLKAEYFLPEKAEEFTRVHLTPLGINGRDMDYGDMRRYNATSSYTNKFKSLQKNAAIYRWIIYRGIEMILERAGLPGHSCMLRSICDHAARPFHHESGLLAEILHIIMSPSTSSDAFVKRTDKEFLYAEKLGHQGAAAKCLRAYPDCKESPIDFISTIFKFIE